MSSTPVKRGGRPYRRMAERLRRMSRVCHICGLPIDPALKAPDPMSFTVDHILPLSMGGAKNELSNVAPAHRVCNQRRGTGAVRPNAPADRSADW